MSRFVKREINSPQMRSVVVLILCTYFWIYCDPPLMLKFYTFGGVSILGGRAPPGVRVILTLGRREGKGGPTKLRKKLTPMVVNIIVTLKSRLQVTQGH